MQELLSCGDPVSGLDRSIAVYNQAVRDMLAFLKATYYLHDLLVKSVSLADNAGYLIPLCELHTDDESLLKLLTDWRNENSFAYPSQFTATVSSTREWLRGRVLDTVDRLLFLVVDRHGKPVGHMGLANAINSDAAVEMDNIVRGVKEGSPGIMTKGMEALLAWTQEMFGPRQIYLRVLEDNEHAIRFYRKLGFVKEKLLPLRRHQEAGGVFYRTPAEGDTAAPDRSFVRMVYAPKSVFAGEQIVLTAGPSISARETSYALDAARYGWNHQWNKYLKKFETAFAEYIGAKYALATSSCTGALHLSLLALGIGSGDEVIVPDLTWVATANAVLYTGATPIFADVEVDSWCLDPASVESKITDRTRAIIPVHLYGHATPMDQIIAIARRHNLRVVEDAAPSIGTEYKGQRTGSFGDFSCFSFQGAKLLVTGEGGMLLTNDKNLYDRAYKVWDQGRVPGTFWIDENGWKYKMSNVQAAIGLGQLERVAELIEAKRRIFDWYKEGLRGLDCVRLNHEPEGTRSIYWMTSILLGPDAPLSRDELRQRLKEKNIDTRPVFPPISRYPIWPIKQPEQPVAAQIGDRGINLPSGVCLSRAQVDYVCGCLRRLVEKK